MPGPLGPISGQVHCPRCWYDLRGTAATWEDAGACPLEGTCTECGYVFLWRDVLRPTFGEPRWCVEYARPVSVPLACFVTLGRSLWPRAFWRRMMLHHEIRPLRLAIYVVLLFVLLYPVFAVGHAAAYQRLTYPMATMDWHDFLSTAFWPFANPRPVGPPIARGTPRALIDYRFSWRTCDPAYVISVAISFAIVMSVVTSAAFICLPTTLRRARVCWAHVWRIGAYGALAPVIALGLFVIPVEECARLLPGLMLAVLPALLLIWWGLAVRHYLRLPHAWGVAAASVAIALLATVVVFYYTVPSFTQIIFGWH